EQGAAEVAEGRRRQHQRPRRVQVAARDQPLFKVAIGVEHTDEAAAGAGDLVLGVSVLFGVGDVDLAADGGDVERGVAGGQGRVGERAVEVGEVEVLVQNVDLAVVEVGEVEEGGGADLRLGDALVDGAVARREADLGRVVGGDAGVPAEDLARLGGE